MHQQELVDVMTEVAESLKLPIDLDETLDRITLIAADAIPGVDYVSISITSKDGHPDPRADRPHRNPRR